MMDILENMPDPVPTAVKSENAERAKYAWECLQDVLTEDHTWRLTVEEQKEFRSYLRSVPMLIRTNGLIAAYAFVMAKSKSKKAYEVIGAISRQWIVDRKSMIRGESLNDWYGNLLGLEGRGQYRYRLIIQELLALFTWLKRFAEGLIDPR